MAHHLVWIDLEMSGLDPKRHRILEAAAVVTDADLEVVAEGPFLVVHQPDEVLSAMDEWCTKHHGESGLVDRVRASDVDEGEAERQLLSFLKMHVAAGAAPLAGNSVHQDRRFLRRYMPVLHDFLHYRNVDVTTIKELVRRWYPALHEARPRKRGGHRALDDIHESIAELRYYRERAFRPLPSGAAPPAPGTP